MIFEPLDCVTILYTANACFDINALVSLFKKALAANSRTSLDPFPIIILLTSKDSCFAINDFSFFESPSGYKCKSSL